MSLKSRVLRRSTLAGLVVLAAVGAGTAPANAAKLTLTYGCTYPLIGEAPLEVSFERALPSRPPYTSGFDLVTAATAGGDTYNFLKLIRARSLEGTAAARTTFALSGGTSLPVTVPLTVDPFTVPATEESLVLTATGTTPNITLPAGSEVRSLTIDAFSLNLRALGADGSPIIFPGSATGSDGDADTFDVPCRLDPPTQSTRFSEITLPTTPTTPGTTPTTPATTPASTTPTDRRLTNTYQCVYPLIGEAPITVVVTSEIPQVVPLNQPTGRWPIAIETITGAGTDQGIALIGARRLTGRTVAGLTVSAPGVPAVPVLVGLDNDDIVVSSPPSPLEFQAQGRIPSLTFPQRGTGKITLDSIALNLKALKADGSPVIFPGSDTDSDRDITTFDVTCRLDPSTQDSTLATFEVGHTDPYPTTAPTAPTTTPGTSFTPPAGVTNVSSSSATVSWTAPDGYTGPYLVTYDHGNVREELQVPGTTANLTELVPVTTYSVSVARATDPTKPFFSVAFLTFQGAMTSPPKQRLNQTYTCTYPLVGDAPLSAQFTANLPRIVAEDAPISNWQLTLEGGVSDRSLTQLGAANVGGTIVAAGSFGLPGGGERAFSAPLALYNFPTGRGFGAIGTIPTQVFPDRGQLSVNLDDLLLSLRATKSDGSAVLVPGSGTDSDGDPATFDVPCRLDPTAQNVELARVTIGANANPTQPTTPSRTTPEPSTPPTTIGQPPVRYAYGLAGSATLKTLTKGTLPLGGTIAVGLDLYTGDFTADLALNPTSGKLVALGFLPVVAKVNIVPTQPVTGSLRAGVLAANAVVRIKLPSVTLFGIPLAGGANCQAAKPSNIALKSTDAFFKPLDGGTLAGTFAISNLTGCGGLTGLVSPLTAGKGNAIALRLTPKN